MIFFFFWCTTSFYYYYRVILSFLKTSVVYVLTRTFVSTNTFSKILFKNKQKYSIFKDLWKIHLHLTWFTSPEVRTTPVRVKVVDQLSQYGVRSVSQTEFWRPVSYTFFLCRYGSCFTQETQLTEQKRQQLAHTFHYLSFLSGSYRYRVYWIYHIFRTHLISKFIDWISKS